MRENVPLDTDPKERFCHVSQGHGRPSSTARGSWTSKGVNDHNHATEMPKQRIASKGHKDAAISAGMTEQDGRKGTVVDLQVATAVKQAKTCDKRVGLYC